MNEYKEIGLGSTKSSQAVGVCFSILILGFLFITDTTPTLVIVLPLSLLIINGFYYLFSDIEFNSQDFFIEKFLYNRKIPITDFIEIKRVIFNVFIIKFTNKKFLFHGDFSSVFDSNYESKLTSEINAIANSQTGVKIEEL